MKKKGGPELRTPALDSIFAEIGPEVPNVGIEEEGLALQVLEVLEVKNPPERRALAQAALKAARSRASDILRTLAAFLALLAERLHDSVKHLAKMIEERGSILQLIPA